MTKKKTEDYKQIAEQLAQELAEAQEQLARERADAMNVRRRAEEDRVKLGSFYKAHVVQELLGFLDNLDRALKHAPAEGTKEWDDWFKGIQSVKKQLDEAMAKIGVERIKTVGEPFDPHVHEAVTMEDGEGTEEIVSEELQSGYKIQDEVIRPAMVRVKLQ